MRGIMDESARAWVDQGQRTTPRAAASDMKAVRR
jgi:hypothetical protein